MKKGKFFIATMDKNQGNANPKAEERDGYIDTINGIQVGFHANRDDKGKILDWVATELSTGFAIGEGKTKKAAMEFVTEHIDALKAKFDDPRLDKYKDIIKKANALKEIRDYDDKVSAEASAVWKRIVGDKKEITPEDVIKIRMESPKDTLIVTGDYMYDGNVTPDEAADWYNGNDKYCKANAKLDKLPEFTEKPTKTEPPKVADKCYATEPTKNNKAVTNVGEVIEEKTEFKVKAKAPVHPKSMFKETNRDKRVKEMVGKLEDGVKEIFESGKYEHYLSIMSKFHRYSLNNNLLIAMQMPTATRVAGYGDWQKKFKRQVRKGEKGIQILGGFPSKRTITDENGEEKEIHFMRYKPVSVFDISQTDGEDLPEICHTIKGDVSGYDSLVAKLRKVSPVKIEFEEINTGANGYYHLADKRIAIKSGMSQAHTIKTMVHEIAHSILHDKDNGNEKEANRQTMEVQAESVAYVVNQYLGLDTSDYSFGYIAGWGEGKEMKELKESLEVIRKTSDEIIKQIA